MIKAWKSSFVVPEGRYLPPRSGHWNFRWKQRQIKLKNRSRRVEYKTFDISWHGTSKSNERTDSIHAGNQQKKCGCKSGICGWYLRVWFAFKQSSLIWLINLRTVLTIRFSLCYYHQQYQFLQFVFDWKKTFKCCKSSLCTGFCTIFFFMSPAFQILYNLQATARIVIDWWGLLKCIFSAQAPFVLIRKSLSYIKIPFRN